MAANQDAAAGQTADQQRERQARIWAMCCHLAGLIVVLDLLVVWLLWWAKRAELPFVDDQGKEALNFRITILLAVMAALIFVETHPMVLALVGTFDLVMLIVAATQAYHGVRFRYPIAIRAIK